MIYSSENSLIFSLLRTFLQTTAIATTKFPYLFRGQFQKKLSQNKLHSGYFISWVSIKIYKNLALILAYREYHAHIYVGYRHIYALTYRYLYALTYLILIMIQNQRTTTSYCSRLRCADRFEKFQYQRIIKCCVPL